MLSPISKLSFHENARSTLFRGVAVDLDRSQSVDDSFEILVRLIRASTIVFCQKLIESILRVYIARVPHSCPIRDSIDNLEISTELKSSVVASSCAIFLSRTKRKTEDCEEL